MAAFSRLNNYHIDDLKKMEALSTLSVTICERNSLSYLYRVLFYYLEHGTFTKLAHCGAVTNNELTKMSEKYLKNSELTFEYFRANEHRLEFEDFKTSCRINFNLPAEHCDVFEEQYYSQTIPLFGFLYKMISYLLNDKQLYIFKNNLGFIPDYSKQTSQAIADHFGIKRNNVTALKKDLPNKITKAVATLVKSYPRFPSNYNYDLDLSKDIILLNKAVVDQFNRQDGLNLTGKFYALLLTGLYPRRFALIQDLKCDYNQYCVVSTHYTKIFEFISFFNDLDIRTGLLRRDDQYVNFDTYVSGFLKPDQIASERLKQICKRIIAEVYKIRIFKGEIIFKRNSLVRTSEYVLSVMRSVQKPMKVEEIFHELKSMAHRIPMSLRALRSTIIKMEEIVPLGKSSTYALKEWDNIKRGTIRELVIEKLEESQDAVHINEIMLFVNKYRDTNKRNVLGNLKLDPKKPFVFFKRGYIGLANRQYKNIKIHVIHKPRKSKNNPDYNDNQLSLL